MTCGNTGGPLNVGEKKEAAVKKWSQICAVWIEKKPKNNKVI